MRSSMLSTTVEVREEEEGGRLGTLYRRHADRAIRLAYLLTGDRGLAEDLVQDAFVKLARRLAHLRDPDAFDAYLRRTVVNLANSHFRRKRLERAYVERLKQAPSPEVEADDPGMRDDLWRRLQALPERQRAALILRFYEDLSEQRIADVLGCRPGTVKSLLSRGLERLRGGMRGE